MTVPRVQSVVYSTWKQISKFSMYPLDAQTILDIQRYKQAWTKEKPTKEGYYWLRNGPEGAEPQIVQVWGTDLRTVELCGSDVAYDAEYIEGEWSGPLEAPK